jgi:hypothetical protein
VILPARAAPLVLIALAMLAAAIVACPSDVPTSTTAVFSLTVDTVPAPSVVAGDTMRDSLGNIQPITAHAYNVHGTLLPNVPIVLVSFDSNQLRFTATGYAIGTPNGDSTPEFVVDANGLQSLPQTLPVVLPPDSLEHADSDSVTTQVLSLTNASVNGSVPLVVTLRHVPDTVGADSVTRSYWVSYHIVYPAFATSATGAITDDTLPIYVVDGNQNPSPLDSTDVNGDGTRYVVFQPALLAGIGDPADSVVIHVTSYYHGQPIPGSPLRFVIHYST